MRTVALAGSGEFTPAMRALDERLIGEGARLLVLTQASAPDGDGVQRRWMERALAHLEPLGGWIQTPPIRTTADMASCERLLAEADIVWLSGGDPLWLCETLRPVRDAMRNVATIAGSSAGAMVLGACCLPKLERKPAWTPGLSLVAGLGVIPHLDEQPQERLDEIIASAPDGTALLGLPARTWVELGDTGPCIGGAEPPRLRLDGDWHDLPLSPSVPDVLGFPASGAGPIALRSADEFTDGAAPFTRELVARAGPRIAVVLAASPGDAAARAVEATAHLGGNGALTVIVDVYTRDQATADRLPDCDVLYLAGGDPSELLTCLADTPFWDEAMRRWASGMALAGSSAGAMALCEHCLVPEPGADKPTRWDRGLGPVERAGLAVHARTRPAGWIGAVAATAPAPVVAMDDDASILLGPDGATVRGRVWPVATTLSEPYRRSAGLLDRAARLR